MIRLLATPPATYNVAQITAPGVVAVNMVGDDIAGYWNDGDEPTQQEWETIVSAHVPVPDPDPVGDLATQLPATTLEEANDLLVQILDIIGGN